jgi:hypothetical protein
MCDGKSIVYIVGSSGMRGKIIAVCVQLHNGPSGQKPFDGIWIVEEKLTVRSMSLQGIKLVVAPSRLMMFL